MHCSNTCTLFHYKENQTDLSRNSITEKSYYFDEMITFPHIIRNNILLQTKTFWQKQKQQEEQEEQEQEQQEQGDDDE